MSNVKHVHITGVAPFNLDEYDGLRELLGGLNRPVCGLRIQWGGMAGRRSNRDMGKSGDAHPDGHTMYMHFRLEGEEAVSTAYIQRLIDSLTRADCRFDHVSYRDVENNCDLLFYLRVPDTKAIKLEHEQQPPNFEATACLDDGSDRADCRHQLFLTCDGVSDRSSAWRRITTALRESVIESYAVNRVGQAIVLRAQFGNGIGVSFRLGTSDAALDRLLIATRGRTRFVETETY